MTRREALGYAAILGAYLAACLLVGAIDTPRPRIVPAADRPPAAVALCRKAMGEPELMRLGTFTAYAYCSCPKCCGQWSGGPTASGTIPQAGRTAAADWSVLPAGTEVYIDGLGWRTVEDTGGGITGDKLDIYMESHEAALEWGVREMEVYMREDTPDPRDDLE